MKLASLPQVLSYAALISFCVCVPVLAFLWRRVGLGHNAVRAARPDSVPVSPKGPAGVELQQVQYCTQYHHAPSCPISSCHALHKAAQSALRTTGQHLT